MPTADMARGEPAKMVAANVRAVRDSRGLHQRELAARLAALGRPLAQTGVSRLEEGQRRVDVDDLVALAVALNVSPSRLLLPDGDMQDLVRPVPEVEVQAWQLWEWLSGLAPLSGEPFYSRITDLQRDYRDEWPGWLRDVFDHELYRALHFRLRHAGRMIARLARPGRPDIELNARREVAAMTRELMQMPEVDRSDMED